MTPQEVANIPTDWKNSLSAAIFTSCETNICLLAPPPTEWVFYDTIWATETVQNF